MPECDFFQNTITTHTMELKNSIDKTVDFLNDQFQKNQTRKKVGGLHFSSQDNGFL